MTFTQFVHRTAILAAGFVLCAAASASAQTTTRPPAGDHGNSAHVQPSSGVAERIATLDERIAMLTSDMRMFAGDLKIQAMAELIEAMIERHALTNHETHRMREKMRDPIDGRTTPPAPVDMEPETLCSPFI
jgi:hypothetical protein